MYITQVLLYTYVSNLSIHICINSYHLGNKSEVEGLQRVSRLILIHHLSPVMILQLKRFSIGSYSVAKDGEHVSFPLVLNMAPYCTSECVQVITFMFNGNICCTNIL